MPEWESVSNQQIAPDDTIELADGNEADVTSVSVGQSGDILVEVRIHKLPAPGETEVIGTYAFPADGHTQRVRPAT